jgi:hypothetical protein
MARLVNMNSFRQIAALAWRIGAQEEFHSRVHMRLDVVFGQRLATAA